MIAQRTIISGSAGPIFAVFSLNESILRADDQPVLCKQHGRAVLLAVLLAGGSSRAMLASARLSCSISQGSCRDNRFCEKWQTPHCRRSIWHSETEWDIATSICALTA